MPTGTINIRGKVYKSVKEVALGSGNHAEAFDCVMDDLNQYGRRVGYADLDINFGSGLIIGKYWWTRKGWEITVDASGVIYKKTSLATTPVAIGGAALAGSAQRVTFADNGVHLVMANGGQMVYTNGATCTTVADADAPTMVTHVIHKDGYILANNRAAGKKDRVQWCALDDVTDWDPLDYFVAESEPDQLEALTEMGTYIYAWGTITTERWWNDGESPFSRQDVIPHGISARYSVLEANNTYYWLNHERRFAFLSDSVAASVSAPVDDPLSRLSTVIDGTADLLGINGRYYAVLNFPTSNKTHVYDLSLDAWYEWGKWDEETATYDMFELNNIIYAASWNVWLGGSRTRNATVKLSADIYQDSGDIMRAVVRTGYIDHAGEYNSSPSGNVRKKGLELRLTMWRGATEEATTEPQMMVRWRDAGASEWSSVRQVGLGLVGDTEQTVRLRRLGIYRKRQYEFIVTDNVPFTIIMAEEDYEWGIN